MDDHLQQGTTGAKNRNAREIGILLVPGFSMMALSAATEPLRAANLMSGRQLYAWHLLSEDGRPVSSSSDFVVLPQHSISDKLDFPLFLVVASLDVANYREQRVFGWLRALAREGRRIGAISTASLLLARAGLLDGYRCTIHWELLREFAEEFPQIEVTRDLFCIDRNRVTCAGGTAALDLMLALITEDHGSTLAAGVAENFLHTRIRSPEESQRMAVHWRYGVTDKRLARAISMMEQNIEEPLPTETIAQVAGVSPRQLDRLFATQFSRTPSRFYMEIRLRHAQLLLRQSTDSILAIALKCGFSSASHFGRCFREIYAETPARVRRGRGPARPISSSDDGAGGHSSIGLACQILDKT